MEYLKRKTAAVNGILDGAGCDINNETMTITLTHGGLNIIKATKTDKALKMLIKKLFGRSVELEFDGATDINTESEEYRSLMEAAEKDVMQSAKQAALAAGNCQ